MDLGKTCFEWNTFETSADVIWGLQYGSVFVFLRLRDV